MGGSKRATSAFGLSTAPSRLLTASKIWSSSEAASASQQLCVHLFPLLTSHFFCCRYVAVENMEKEYAQSKFVNQLNGGVMVVADGKMDRPCVLVQANMIEISKLAADLGVSGSPLVQCRHPDVEKAVRQDMLESAMKTLSPLEKIVGVRLLPGTEPNDSPLSETAPWTVDNGGVLASNKLGRKAIERELAPIIRELRQRGIFD